MKSRFRNLIIALCAAASFVAAPCTFTSALAATVEALGISAMAGLSDTVVEDTIQATRAGWTLDRSRIVTVVELVVEQVHAGFSALGPRTIEVAGGRVGDVALTIPGAPTFLSGEHVVLFLENDLSLVFPVVALEHGRLASRTDPTTRVETLGNEAVGWSPGTDVLAAVAASRVGRCVMNRTLLVVVTFAVLNLSFQISADAFRLGGTDGSENAPHVWPRTELGDHRQREGGTDWRETQAE